MNILFVSVHFEENAFYRRIAACLTRARYCCRFVSLARQAVREAGDGPPVEAMADLLDSVRGAIDQGQSALEALESRYELISLRHLYLADRGLRNRSEAQRLERTVSYFAAWERYFDGHEIDYVLTDVGPELIRRTVDRVAKARGIPCVFLSCLPFPNELTLSESDFYQVDPALLHQLRPLTPSEYAIVDAHVARVKASRPVTFHVPFRLSPARVRRFFRHLWIDMVVERGGHEHFRKIEHVQRRFMSMIRRRVAAGLYGRFDQGVRYVYLPLHACDEFSLLVKAPHCIDQEYIVRLTADALPQGVKLYVKEHPSSVGHVRLRTLRSMAAVGNVIVLPPEINSHRIIAAASAVVTINSTVGLEALMYEKPVITLGYAYYAGCGVTIDVRDFFELPAAIKRALRFNVEKSRVYSLLYAIMSSTWPGRVFADSSDENVRVVAASIAKRLHGLPKASMVVTITTAGETVP